MHIPVGLSISYAESKAVELYLDFIRFYKNCNNKNKFIIFLTRF